MPLTRGGGFWLRRLRRVLARTGLYKDPEAQGPRPGPGVRGLGGADQASVKEGSRQGSPSVALKALMPCLRTFNATGKNAAAGAGFDGGGGGWSRHPRVSWEGQCPRGVGCSPSAAHCCTAWLACARGFTEIQFTCCARRLLECAVRCATSNSIPEPSHGLRRRRPPPFAVAPLPQPTYCLRTCLVAALRVRLTTRDFCVWTARL